MITEYHRPETLSEAVALVSRKIPRTVPLGGGSFLTRNTSEDLAVVDLQCLKLDSIMRNGNTLEIGAMVTLQALVDSLDCPATIRDSLCQEMSANQRGQATVAGSIVVEDGRSVFLITLLALGTQLIWAQAEEETAIGDYLALRTTWPSGGIMVGIRIPLNVTLQVESVSRTPGDRAILGVALCRWASGRTRLALGGFGNAPILAMDGPEAIGAVEAAGSVLREAYDCWASAEYRSGVGMDLVHRMILKKE